MIFFFISIALGSFCISVKKTFDEERFKQNASLVTEKLQIAQDLMMLYDFDSSILFIHTAKGTLIESSLIGTSCDSLDKPSLKKLVNSLKKPALLKGVFISFTATSSSSKNFQLHFKARGEQMPEGSLLFSPSEIDTEQDRLSISMHKVPRQTYYLTSHKQAMDGSYHDELEKLYPWLL